MLCFHNSLGLGGELVHNQRGNIICLEILTCYDTSLLLIIASWFCFVTLWCWLKCLKIAEWDVLLYIHHEIFNWL